MKNAKFVLWDTLNLLNLAFSKNVSQDYIWLENQPIFGEDFAFLK